MATRSSVLIKEGKKSILLYHHWDGYIEGVGFDLLKRFWLTKDRYFNNDKGFVFAETIANALVKDIEANYEIVCFEHCDIEFLYMIDVKKRELIANEVKFEYDEQKECYNKKIIKVWTFEDIKKRYDELKGEQQNENQHAY